MKQYTVSMAEKTDNALMFQFNSKYINLTIEIIQTRM